MRRLLWNVAFVLLTASCAIGQEASSVAPLSTATVKPPKVMVYTVGPGVTAPELLPTDQSPIPEEKCKKKVTSTIPISIYVDAEGVPRDLTLLYPNHSKLDELALKIVAGDRFKPGTYNGQPVPVAENILVTLVANDQVLQCSPPKQTVIPIQEPQEEDVSDIGTLYHVGTGVIPPALVNNVAAEFSDESREAGLQGTVLLSLIVDTKGMPRNIQVTRPLGMGLDEKSIEAVKKYRFKPATKDGKPIAVPVNIEINFRLYNRPHN
ncbi:MAG TPA: energy transducer TonB [Terracidiphilus sp.]|jgi:TonB family protein